MNVKVLNKEGQETGREVNLADDIFGIEPNDHAMYLSVKQFMANNRQGTHKTKEKWEVARTTKKAFRQKGTGGARRGSMKSPLVKGGGNTFGPQPHSYNFKINKKVKEIARKSALAYKAKDGNIIVLEDLAFNAPKTKEFAKVLASLNVNNVKSLFITNEGNNNLLLSARNIPSIYVTEARLMNIYEIMDAKKLVISEGAVKEIESLYNNKN